MSEKSIEQRGPTQHTDGAIAGGVLPAHDGGVYVRCDADIVARLGPEFDPMWSRTLTYDWP